MSTRQQHSLPSIFLILLCQLLYSPAYSNSAHKLLLPDMGESIDNFMSAQQEQQLGQAFMRSIRHSLTIMDDPQISSYIQSLGQRLAAYSNQPQQNFHFFVINDPNINAFAGPGGYIGIHSGLILATQSEDELAAVIAHELAHVTQRHIARAYQNNSNMSLPLTAAIIAAIILGSKTDMGQLGEAALATAIAGSTQQQINFTRSNEQEADRIGMNTLAQSGYAIEAMSIFFTRLLQANQFQEDVSLEFLRSHPLTSHRIAGSSVLPNTTDNKKLVLKKSTQRQFRLIQTRINVLSSNKLETLGKMFAQQENISALKLEARQYGLALIAIHNNNGNRARELLTPLEKIRVDTLTYTLAAIENELNNGSQQRALTLAKKEIRIYPENLALILLYTQALLKNKYYIPAIKLIRRHIHKIKDSPLLYSHLAEAEAKNGNRSATHQAMAEFYFLNGDSDSALNQIQLALDIDMDVHFHPQRKLKKNVRLQLLSRKKTLQQIIKAEAGH